MNKAILLKSDGTIQEIKPNNAKTGFDFKELYSVLECDMIEIVNLADGRIMLVDEEYRFKDVLIKNIEATELYRQGRCRPSNQSVINKAQYGENFIDLTEGESDEEILTIYGNAIVCPSNMVR